MHTEFDDQPLVTPRQNVDYNNADSTQSLIAHRVQKETAGHPTSESGLR
jgi:hypothetical protein